MAQELAGMRVDYVGEGLDVDGLAGTWHEQLAQVVRRGTGGGDPRGQRHGAGHRGRRRAAVVAHGALQGARRARRRLLHQLHLGEEPRPARHPVRVGHLPLVRPAPAGAPARPGRGVAPEETQEYWASRPRGSQLGAWASPQSTVVRDRRALDDALAAVTQRFADDEPVPVPGHWGGWRIRPEQVEFWQGRADRMHDRLRFVLDPDDRSWAVRRLAP